MLSSTFKKYHQAIIPFGSKLTPEACRALATALEETISFMQAWDLPISSTSRLQHAKNHLTKVAENKSFGNNDDGLLRTAKAAALAIDFYIIPNSLQTKKHKAIATEIATSLKGNLSAEKKSTNAYEMQSQFWVGSLLARADLQSKVPVTERRKPDFLISLGTLDCGVEVKRPQKKEAIKRTVGDAAKQIADFKDMLPGIVVLDLSECLNTDRMILPKHNRPPKISLKVELSHITDDLLQYVHNYNRSEKFKRILIIVGFVRYWIWNSEESLEPDAGFYFNSIAFPDSCGGLLNTQIKEIQKRLMRGLNKVSGNPVLFTVHY